MQKRLGSALALVVLALACAGEANALVQRTFVSKFGVDTNSCSATEPCRTFAAAIAQTQAGGEVLALDTAGYGPVTITKAISLISPPGVYAGITTTAAGTNAITVNAGPNDVVVLKGLSLSGLGVGIDGVAFTGGKALRVEGLTVSGFVAGGVAFFPSASAQLTVTDSVVRDNGSSGIYAVNAPGQVSRVAIDRTRMTGNDFGVYASTESRVLARDSVSTGNVSFGFYANVNAVLNLENCVAAHNGWGIVSDGLVRVAGTTVTENTFGLAFGLSSSIISRGNNTVEGNGTNGTFTGTFTPK